MHSQFPQMQVSRQTNFVMFLGMTILPLEQDMVGHFFPQSVICSLWCSGHEAEAAVGSVG